MKRTTNKSSVINVKKAQREKELGELINDKKPWTVRDKNLLLICYLGGMSYISDGVGMYDIFGRSEKSLSRMVWGIAVEYCDNRTGFSVNSYYEAHQRFFRRGKKWTKREYKVMLKCLSKNYSGSFKWSKLAEIMGREEQEVRDKIRALTVIPNLTLPGIAQTLTEEGRIAKAITVLKRISR